MYLYCFFEALSRIRSLDPGDHMLSQKLLVDNGRNRLSVAKIRKNCPHFACIASFRPTTVVSGPHRSLALFHIGNHVIAVAEVLANLPMLLSWAEL